METHVDYQMPSYTTLMVTDLDASVRWYCDVLGFTRVYQMPGPGGRPFMVHLRWAPHADLLLVSEGPNHPTPEPRGAGVTLNFTALRESVDAIADRARQNGVVQISGPHNRPWLAREVIIIDPDGYRLNFTETLRKPLEGKELMEALHRYIEDGALN